MMERLNRMNPEERERLLKGLPPARRTALEDRLRRYEEMPPAAKERLRRDYDDFQSLTPEKQDEARKLFHRLSQVPEERRRDLRREIIRLRNMRPERRDARMGSDRFRSEFNDDERQVLQGLVDVLPNSAPPPGTGPVSRPAQSPLTH